MFWNKESICATMSVHSRRSRATALRPALSPTWSHTFFWEVAARRGQQMHNNFAFRGATLLVGAPLVALIISNSGRAQSVTLRSLDGSATVSGLLLRFDGNAYTIKTGAH